MNRCKHAVFLFATAVMLIIQSGCAGKKTQEPVTRQSFYFDTVCSIAVYDMENMSGESAAKAISHNE